MSVTLVRIALQNVSGMAKDQVVNDFVFNAPSSDADAVAAVTAIYNVSPDGGGSNPLGLYINSEISRVAPVQWSTYDLTAHLDGSPHGSPTATGGFILRGPSSTNQLPDQVAGVMSYHAIDASVLESGPSGPIPTPDRAVDEGAPATHVGNTRPKSSLRGRLYIGPLTIEAVQANGVTSAAFSASMQACGIKLMTDALGWCVWSRRTASVHNIVGGWTDTGFGVVRKRNTAARLKAAWTGHP
jgi:hypothetical protein